MQVILFAIVLLSSLVLGDVKIADGWPVQAVWTADKPSPLLRLTPAIESLTLVSVHVKPEDRLRLGDPIILVKTTSEKQPELYRVVCPINNAVVMRIHGKEGSVYKLDEALIDLLPVGTAADFVESSSSDSSFGSLI